MPELIWRAFAWLRHSDFRRRLWNVLVYIGTIAGVATVGGWGYVIFGVMPLQAQERADRERIARSDLGDTELQRKRAYDLLQDGHASEKRGQFDAARKSYEAAHAIYERLAAADPAQPLWQLYLALSHETLGNILTRPGHLDAALERFQAELRILERLKGQLDAVVTSLEAHPEILKLLERSDHAKNMYALVPSYLSRTHNSTGRVLALKGEPNAALKHFESAIAISERFASSDPGNPEWQYYLVVSHASIGDVLQSKGRLEAALERYKTALAIAENPNVSRRLPETDELVKALRKLIASWSGGRQ